jgi:uncharacterized protein (TIGR03435 family)
MRIAGSVLVIAVVCTSGTRAQSPAFEVATVKENHSRSGRSSSPWLINGRMTAENATLRMILRAAYGLTALQIEGPSWLDSDRFDLEAKSPPGVPDSELMPMLQSLLKERFQLAAHHETKEMPVFDMVVAKGGLKIAPFDPAHIPPTPPRNGAASMIIGPMTMSQLAGRITPDAGRPVLDKTGLDATRYFCAATFSPLSAQSADSAPESGLPDIFRALEQQLGLKLEPAKEPLEILIVDHAERVPTEN